MNKDFQNTARETDLQAASSFRLCHWSPEDQLEQSHLYSANCSYDPPMQHTALAALSQQELSLGGYHIDMADMWPSVGRIVNALPPMALPPNVPGGSTLGQHPPTPLALLPPHPMPTQAMGQQVPQLVPLHSAWQYSPGIPPINYLLGPSLKDEGKRITLNCKSGRLGEGAGKKTHICPLPGCGKLYGTTTNLKMHIRIHNGEKPFACEWAHCGKLFTRLQYLRRHILFHTGEKPFVCEVCTRKFRRSDSLRRHVKLHDKLVVGELDNSGGGADSPRSQLTDSVGSQSTASIASSSSLAQLQEVGGDTVLNPTHLAPFAEQQEQPISDDYMIVQAYPYMSPSGSVLQCTNLSTVQGTGAFSFDAPQQQDRVSHSLQDTVPHPVHFD